jgi:hypothetical protein
MAELPATHKCRVRTYAKPSGALINEYTAVGSTGSFHGAQDGMIVEAARIINGGEGTTTWGDSALTLQDSDTRHELKVIAV